MSDVDEEEVAGEEEEEEQVMLAAPDDTYADDDFDGGVGKADDDEPAQGETSYAADEDYKDDLEPEPEPSRKAVAELEDENSYADDFEQSMVPGASRVPDDDEDQSGVIGDSIGVAAAGAAVLARSSSRASSAAGSRPGSAVPSVSSKPSSAPKSAPAAAAPKPAAASKPAADTTSKAAPAKPAVPARPVAAAASKPAAPKPAAPKPAAAPPVKQAPPAPKPAVPRAAPGAVKPAAQKPAPAPVVPAKPAVPPRNMAPAAPPPAQPPPVGVGTGGQKVKLTFTGPPNTARAAPTVKPDYSHSSYEVKKISSDNTKLCNRLVEISRAPPNPAYSNALSVGSAAVTGKLAPANVAAATVNRHKKEDKIAQENLALYKRLQSVKPTPTVNRDVLNKDFAKTQAYGENARKVKAPPPGPAAAAPSAAKLAASGVARQPVAGSAEDVYSRPSAGSSRAGSTAGAAAAAPPPNRSGSGSGVGVGAGAPDLSTVMEGPEGESSEAVFTSSASAARRYAGSGGGGGALEPEYSMDPEFEQTASQSFAE